MSEQQSSYRQIVKATSIFGGVQVFQIIIQIIRSKFIAILLGPAGMGIVGLLISTISLIGSVTNFGLGVSSIKNLAESYANKDQEQLSKIVIVLKRLIWVTGFLGVIFTCIFSPFLSQLTFNNNEYTIAFLWLSVTLLFNQLTNGQLAILQGLHRLNYLAKANLYGSAFGLIITVPLYYFWGIKSIVPVIILTSFTNTIITFLFTKKIRILKDKVSKDQTLEESKKMLTMGIFLSLSGLITLGTSYVVKIYINRTGGVADVGMYNAGFAIINTYVGIIFTALGTEYYPRLSAVAQNIKKSNITINQQAEVTILILGPILIFFLVFINWIVIILYSEKFIPINGMIYWAALGIFFKAMTWTVGFIFLAKGSSKIYFWNELFSNLYALVLNIIGYKFWGLTGLGFSFLIWYIIALIQVYFIAKFKFEFSFNKGVVNIFSIQFFLAICTFSSVKLLPTPYPLIVGIILICISLIISFKDLDKRIGIRTLIANYRKNK